MVEGTSALQIWETTNQMKWDRKSNQMSMFNDREKTGESREEEDNHSGVVQTNELTKAKNMTYVNWKIEPGKHVLPLVFIFFLFIYFSPWKLD